MLICFDDLLVWEGVYLSCFTGISFLDERGMDKAQLEWNTRLSILRGVY